MLDFEKIIKGKREREIERLRKRAILISAILLIMVLGYFKLAPTGYSIKRAILEQNEKFCMNDVFCKKLVNLSSMCKERNEECIYLLALLTNNITLCNELHGKMKMKCERELHD